MKIAALITCHNRKQLTLGCLKCLFLQNGIGVKFEIDVYLVDDGSTDGTYESILADFPKVTIIRGDGALFWNRGMHLAWDFAVSQGAYDFYLWLNDDTKLLPNAICELLECCESINGAVIVCGAICSEDSKKFTYGGSTISGRQVEPNGTIQKVQVINGNCVLVNKATFAKIGNLDKQFPHAIGDHDYGLRLLSIGGTNLTTRSYVGYCEKNKRLPNWCYSETSLFERYKSLYSELGNSHPKYFFIYEMRHFGWLTAIKHYVSIHLRALMPSLWK